MKNNSTHEGQTATARIDKWLWAARIFKTRSIAADACKNGRVVVNNANAKPSRPLKVGEVVNVRKPPVTYSFKVLKCIEQRVPNWFPKSTRTSPTPSSTNCWK